jgi:hypothetical protein
MTAHLEQIWALIYIDPHGMGMGPFVLNPEIKVGDLLTPITVFLSVLTFAWTIRKDIRSRLSAEADLVRGAAAKALGKLERWKELALWHYRDVQPTFVETSDLLAKEFDVEKARDHLWSALQTAHVASGERLLNEALETAFVELSSSYPGVYDAFGKTITEMKALDVEAHGELLTLTQSAVLSYRTRQNTYIPPLLGNDLRGCASAVSAYLDDQLGAIVRPVRQFLIKSIKQNDDELLHSKKMETQIPGPSARPYRTMTEFLRKHSSVKSPGASDTPTKQ